MRELNIASVRDAVHKELLHGSKGELLSLLLSRGAGATVFAGGIRDAFLAHECGLVDLRARDWDIGLSGISPRAFEGAMRELGAKKNRYGGFKLTWRNSQSWEFWRQEATVGLRKTRAPFSIENILRSFVLSCNAIAFDVKRDRLYEHAALQSLESRRISILQDAIMHDRPLFSAKALALHIRLPLRLTPPLGRFISRHLRAESLAHELAKTYPMEGAHLAPRAARLEACRK